MSDSNPQHRRIPTFVFAADFLTGLVAVLGVFALAWVVGLIHGG